VRRKDSDAGPSLNRAESLAVSKRVRELRLTAGLLQADIAFEIGCGATYVSSLEGGRHNWRQRNAEKALAFLGTSLAAALADGEA
jgi:transcriptional regulator with XRE-family HTH domain